MLQDIKYAPFLCSLNHRILECLKYVCPRSVRLWKPAVHVGWKEIKVSRLFQGIQRRQNPGKHLNDRLNSGLQSDYG